MLLWLQVFTSACKSAVVFPVGGVPVVFPLSLKRVDFARCGFFPFATLGAVCFSALLARVSMPKVGHTRKACTLSRSRAFAWLVVYLFLLVPLKAQVVFKGAANKPSSSLFGSALLFLIRCDVSRLTGAHTGARAPVVGRRLVYSFRRVSLLPGLHCLHKPQTGRKYMPQNRRKTRVLWLTCVPVLPHTRVKAVVKVQSCALPRL